MEIAGPLTDSQQRSLAGQRAGDNGSYYEPGQSGYRWLVIALFAASVATFAALYSTQPLIGTLAHHFSLTEAHAAWSVSAATLFVGFGMLIASPLSDRYGRPAIIKTSLLATAALSAVCALASSWPLLLIARALQGLALSGTPAVALAYLREEVQPSAHPRATGLYIGGTAIGGMCGRLLVGGVTDLGGWRWGIGAIAILGGVCALIVVFWLPTAHHGPKQAAATAVLAAEAAEIEVQSSATSEISSLTALGAAEPSLRQRLLSTLRALADVRLLGLYAFAAMSMGAFVAIYNVLGLRLTAKPYLLSVSTASLVFCVYPVGSVGSVIAGRLAGRHGRGPVMVGGALLALAGVALTAARPLLAVVVGVALVTAGFFAAHGVASGWASALGQRRGVLAEAAACYLLSYYIGSSLFGAFGTSIWSAHRWSGVAVMTGALFALAAVVALTAARDEHRRRSAT